MFRNKYSCLVGFARYDATTAAGSLENVSDFDKMPLS